MRIWPAVCCAVATTVAAAEPAYVSLPGGELRTVLPEKDALTVHVAAFSLRALPVTNGEFLAFVRAHPEWQRGRVSPLLAGPRYLDGWRAPLKPGALSLRAPVVNVSWHAARAYCAGEQARLPSWREWEFAAAADETRTDARDDPVWREKILAWYAHPTGERLPDVGLDAANVYGVHDLHAAIFEWVEDFNGLFVAGDSRAQGEENNLATCGAGALALADTGNYAIVMRVALLSSLQGGDTVSSLGFRCARDAAPAAKGESGTP